MKTPAVDSFRGGDFKFGFVALRQIQAKYAASGA